MFDQMTNCFQLLPIVNHRLSILFIVVINIIRRAWCICIYGTKLPLSAYAQCVMFAIANLNSLAQHAQNIGESVYISTIL